MLDADKDKRIKEEGKQKKRPLDPDYLVHHDGKDWVCSASDCFHGIHKHSRETGIPVEVIQSALGLMGHRRGSSGGVATRGGSTPSDPGPTPRSEGSSS